MNSKTLIVGSLTSLPKTIGWNINNGDYINIDETNNSSKFLNLLSKRKRIDKYSLFLTMVATSFFILFIVDLLSKI